MPPLREVRVNRPDSEGGYLPEASFADTQEARGLIQCGGCRSWLEPEQVAGRDVNLVFGACCWTCDQPVYVSPVGNFAQRPCGRALRTDGTCSECDGDETLVETTLTDAQLLDLLTLTNGGE